MKMRLKSPVTLIGFLILASLSCRTILATENADQSGKIVFKDDFSDPTSGWNRATSERGITDYSDGVYRIFVNQPNTDIWSKPGLSLRDVQIDVDALKVGGDRDNRFGIICRAVDSNHFYTFIISSDGYFGIGRISGKDYELVGMEALERSSAIRMGSELNHIRVDCIGSKLSLYINGQKIIEVEDTELSSGDVGLIAGTYETPGTDIRFDNFIVYEP